MNGDIIPPGEDDDAYEDNVLAQDGLIMYTWLSSPYLVHNSTAAGEQVLIFAMAVFGMNINSPELYLSNVPGCR